jgi:hypothetical protein
MNLVQQDLYRRRASAGQGKNGLTMQAATDNRGVSLVTVVILDGSP